MILAKSFIQRKFPFPITLNHNCPGQITEFLMFHVFFILYLYLAEVYSIDVTELLNIATLLYSVPTVL